MALPYAAGFGLGALNDADEDDLDVYDAGPTQTSRRLAYDVDEEDEQIAMGKTGKTKRVRCQISKVVNRSLLQKAFSADSRGIIQFDLKNGFREWLTVPAWIPGSRETCNRRESVRNRVRDRRYF